MGTKEKINRSVIKADVRQGWSLSVSGSIAYERRKISASLDLKLTKPPKNEPERS